jgi:hypothetical protein
MYSINRSSINIIKREKGKIGKNLVDDCRDNKEIIDDNDSQHIIPMKHYSKYFEEGLKSTKFKSFRLAQMQLHKKGFKEDSIEWLRTKKMGSHQNVIKQRKVYKSSNYST